MGIGAVLNGAKLFAKPLMANGKRMAGQAVTNYLGGPATAKNQAEKFGLDAVFGVMAGMNTPGDLGDKLIAGTTVGTSGALGGMLGTSAVGALRGGKMPTGFGRQMTEVGGSILGDEVGFAASEGLQRLKGGGQTGYERMAADGDQQYRQQLEEEFMRKYGLLPSVPSSLNYGQDYFMQENGLA